MNNSEVITMLTYFANANQVAQAKSVQISLNDTENKDVYCLKVPGSAFVIKQNDIISVTGNCHVSLMNYLIKETFDEADMKMLAEVIDTAVQQEIQWGQHTYGDSILGISKESTENYIKYIANNRAKSVGIGVLYKGFNINPYAYLDMKKKENFFETSVTEYSQSTAVAGWDDF